VSPLFILIILYNKELCDGVATEKMIMQGCRLCIEGESVDVNKGKDNVNAVPDDVYDGAGNKIEVKRVRTDQNHEARESLWLLARWMGCFMSLNRHAVVCRASSKKDGVQQSFAARRSAMQMRTVILDVHAAVGCC